MKSSAMRDLMALTERPEVISLAGGLPDTSTFPPELCRADEGRGARSLRARAAVRPDRGHGRRRERIVEVMAAEGTLVDPDDVLVTTGAQQAIDLVCKALIDPGDVIIAEAPTYPGAVPTFCAYQAEVVQIEMDADGMRVDELEDTLDRPRGRRRRPKFIYTIPNFQNPGGVTMSLPGAGAWSRSRASASCWSSRTTPTGCCATRATAADAARARRRRVRDLPGHVLEDPLARHPARLGGRAAPVLEKMNIGKQSADLCSSSMTQHFVDAYFAAGDWREYIESLRGIYRRRRDTMLDALAEHFPPEATWTRPEGGLFVWATLPDYIDTTDLLARALTGERRLRAR